MPSLLEFVEIKTNKNPVMMASPIAPDLDGPFLVSSTKGFLWVREKFSGNFIRSATRKGQVVDMFKSIVEEVSSKSKEMGWGSSKPFTEQGIKEAMLYLSYYGFSEFDLTLNSKSTFSMENKPENLFFSWEPWVPEDVGVLTPTDKSYLGTLYSFGNGNYSCCVHNPSRGICILK